MVAFIVTMITISVFLVGGVILHMYIRLGTTPRRSIKREQHLHDVIFEREIPKEDFGLLVHL